MYSSNSHLQYVNLANGSPCDVIMKMADSREDGDRKLRIFAYLDIGVTTLSTPLVFTHGTHGTALFTEIKILHVSGPLSTFYSWYRRTFYQ